MYNNNNKNNNNIKLVIKPIEHLAITIKKVFQKITQQHDTPLSHFCPFFIVLEIWVRLG
jgi:DNA-binding XRE family transcriptional regulator